LNIELTPADLSSSFVPTPKHLLASQKKKKEHNRADLYGRDRTRRRNIARRRLPGWEKMMAMIGTSLLMQILVWKTISLLARFLQFPFSPGYLC
jgi:hypothetical protein